MSESRKTIDARGLPCPQPVILTKKAAEEGGVGILEVLVDNAAAKDNVLRYAGFAGLGAELTASDGGVYRIEVKLGSDGGKPATPAPVSAPTQCVPAAQDIGGATVFISADKLGKGDDELGALLMRGFTYALSEAAVPPARLILMNGGVRLAVEGSESLANLKRVSERGVDVVACGTCLDFFGLKEKLGVGRISNMYEIAEALLSGRTVTVG